MVLNEAGELILDKSGKPVEPDDYPTQIFSPSVVQVGSALGLIVLGFCVTLGVDRVGGGKEKSSTPPPDDPPTES